MKINNFRSYDRIYNEIQQTYYPKNTYELKKIVRNLIKKKNNFLIRGGLCGYGNKVVMHDRCSVVSLEKFNRIIKFNLNKKVITCQPGVKVTELFDYISKKNLIIYNIPGGNNISVGGAISGNVHGRPNSKKYAVFGDNVISLKIIDDNGYIRNIKKNNKLFLKIIGGLGMYGIIIETTLKLHDQKRSLFKIFHKNISNFSELLNLKKSEDNFYGYINPFFSNIFEGRFMVIKKIGKEENLTKEKDYNILFKTLELFKIDIILSFIINKYFLMIFYNFLFRIIKFFPNKPKKINLRESVYLININNYLQNYFFGGLVELQFSVNNNNFLKSIHLVKSLFKKHDFYPHFYILKKIPYSKKKYIFNFPKYHHVFSVGVSFKRVVEKKEFLEEFYRILKKLNCDIYVTKDQFALRYYKSYFKNILKKNNSNFSRYTSSKFKEELKK